MKRWGIQQRLRSCLALMSLSVLVVGMGIAKADPSATPPAGLSALGTPALMPSFQLSGVDGTLLDSATLQGKVVVVRFWATW